MGEPFHSVKLVQCFSQLHHWVEADSTIPTCDTQVHDAVEAHSCVDIVATFTDEQYTTINQSTAGHFDPRVFVNSSLQLSRLAHSCQQLFAVSCKQLTKTLGSKRPAVD